MEKRAQRGGGDRGFVERDKRIFGTSNEDFPRVKNLQINFTVSAR